MGSHLRTQLTSIEWNPWTGSDATMQSIQEIAPESRVIK